MKGFILLHDYAKVTSKGIKFRNLTFSCERAIREQWFEYAKLYGGWTIKVAFYPHEHNMIYLPMESDMECCRAISPQEYKGSKLEKYFRSIQTLKSKRRCLHKDRNRNKNKSL